MEKKIWNVCRFKFPAFGHFKAKIFLRNREKSYGSIFGQRNPAHRLSRRESRSWPLKRGIVSNQRRRSDLNGYTGPKRPFKWSDLRNCELYFNFRGKSRCIGLNLRCEAFLDSKIIFLCFCYCKISLLDLAVIWMQINLQDALTIFLADRTKDSSA